MSDYNFLMESRLSPEQYKVLTNVSRIAADQGLNLYLVGGAVRDLTYGQQVVRDLDFAVEGNPQRILRHLASDGTPASAPPALGSASAEPAALENQDFDSRLSSAELRFSNGVRAELSMCRQEIYTRPGQRPDILPAMIFDDLKRRDFSVNAMAVSLHPNSRGLLLDPTNGAADIERHELRVLTSRSFQEDPLRIYRLLRLGLRLDFKPDEKTQAYLQAALEARAWERLEPEQQGRDLQAILSEDYPARILKLLAEKKLLAGLDKKLASARLPYDRFPKVRSSTQDVPGADPFLLNFYVLVEKLGSAHKVRLAKKIIGDLKRIKTILSIEKDAKKLARVLGSAKAKLPSQVYALLSNQPLTMILFLRVTSTRAVIQNRIKNYLFKYTQVRARLPRAELQVLGAKPGKEFEKVLERVFVEQLDGKIKTPQQLTKRLRELAGIKEPPPKPAPPKAAATKALAAAAAAHTARKGKQSAPPVAGSKGKPTKEGAPAPTDVPPAKNPKTAKPEKPVEVAAAARFAQPAKSGKPAMAKVVSPPAKKARPPRKVRKR